MKALAICILLLASLSATAEDMRAYRRETQTLVQRGQYREALERMVWFHHHALEQDPTVYGTRLTTALDAWKRLASYYGPAKQALTRTRDRSEERLLERGGSRQIFNDLVAINRALGEAGKSLEIFQKLHDDHPQAALRYWNLIKDDVLVQMDVDLADEYVTDPMIEFVKIKKSHERSAKLAANRPNSDPEILRHHQELFVTKSRTLAGVAAKRDDSDTTVEIQQTALNQIDEPALRSIITDGLPELPSSLPPAADPPAAVE
ncbi:hypothetical protein [Haloferula sp.]|uniref:hypothetical protein n=1 Tax=Haloferula sp. TaxID=2497595 RepID=UPI00329CD408